MNLILKNTPQIKFYTYLDDLFLKIPELKEYIYFISDLETNRIDVKGLKGDEFFITGTELAEVTQNEKIQFIWAVLSAFDAKPLKIEPEAPYADGNPDFWRTIPTPQAKGAKFEIICWDSSATLFINIPTEIEKKLRTLYPDIKELKPSKDS